jgi:hypothetical protein
VFSFIVFSTLMMFSFLLLFSFFCYYYYVCHYIIYLSIKFILLHLFFFSEYLF